MWREYRAARRVFDMGREAARSVAADEVHPLVLAAFIVSDAALRSAADAFLERARAATLRPSAAWRADVERAVEGVRRLADDPSNFALSALAAEPDAGPTADQVETLVDLARAGDESTFRDLAAALGVAADRLDALWAGTVARARKRGGAA